MASLSRSTRFRASSASRLRASSCCVVSFASLKRPKAYANTPSRLQFLTLNRLID